jgi:MoaA/NifB/PqqE/SkfB family radical SAM enzyme
MHVSCNSLDSDTSGTIGNLREKPLLDILKDKRAMEFRKALQKGEFPLNKCITCNYKRLIRSDESGMYMDKIVVNPLGLRIEGSKRCNLACISCQIHDVPVQNKNDMLSVDDVKVIASEINKHSVQSLVYTAFGEPFFFDSIYDQLSILKAKCPGVKISTSTNGTVLNSDKKREAALCLDHLYISIFGVDNETVRVYQKKSSFDKAYANMKALVEYRNAKGLDRPIIEWKYVLFNWNDKKKYAHKAMRLAEQSGVDILFFKPTINPRFGMSWRYFLRGDYEDIGISGEQGRFIYYNAALDNAQHDEEFTILTPGMMKKSSNNG